MSKYKEIETRDNFTLLLRGIPFKTLTTDVGYFIDKRTNKNMGKSVQVCDWANDGKSKFIPANFTDTEEDFILIK